MLGAQVYSVYTRTQAEKGYHNKLKEIEKWFHSSTDKHEKELENLIKAHRSLDKLKYCVNDALACMHYKDDKKFEGIIDVMENIYTIINNEDLFKEDYREKLDVACYFIAKNLKEYKTDITFKQKDSVAIIRILGRWNKRYNQINFKQDSAQYIQQKIKNLDKVIDTLFHNLVNNNFSYTMSDYDWNLLCQIATN